MAFILQLPQGGVNNHIILEAEIAPYVTSERKQAVRLIEQLEEKSRKSGIKNLYLFDLSFTGIDSHIGQQSLYLPG